MNTVGLERRWIRSSMLGARFGLRGPLVVLSTCLVFACSFAISRTLHVSAAARGEQPLSLPVASVSAAIPASLRGVPQIASTLQPPAPASAKPSQGSGAATSLAPSLPEAPAPAATAPSPSSAPAPEPAPSAPAHSESPAPSHPSSSGGGHTSSGGSFESSG